MRAVLAALALASVGATAAAGALAGDTSRVVIRTRVVVGDPAYIEGAVAYASVERNNGRKVVTRRIDKPLRLRLAPGTYRLRSWLRVCNGNCGLLGPPTDRCSRRFALRRGRPLTATIRITYDAHPCTITFSHT